MVAIQTNSYLDTNNLIPPLQSTETALLRVLNDILMTLDYRQDVVLIMLDICQLLYPGLGTVLIFRKLYSSGFPLSLEVKHNRLP